MNLPKRYNPRTTEPILQAEWQNSELYHYDPASPDPVFSIDTPPPTVSGNLHLGHVYSYSHADFIARYQRMNGRNVFYPMGFDDNGLATVKLVERTLGIKAADMDREDFIQKCLEVSAIAGKEYKQLWIRLGLSIDWRYSYRTIDTTSRRIAQLSFIDLVQKGLAYRHQAPALWCPECQTALAQADLSDIERQTTFYTLAFQTETGSIIPIATTRPELLVGCVAVFVNPEDGRFLHLIGQKALVPIFNQVVPIMGDPGADPHKGTGLVMCCTFGDSADVEWWRIHKLPLIEVVGHDGRLTTAAGQYQDLTVKEARAAIVQRLAIDGMLLNQEPSAQSVRVHERCDTPVEYIVTNQWFIRILEFKEELLDAGEKVHWRPAQMKGRYRQWVENLNWDWGISRQRFYGVPFPVWYCTHCGEFLLAKESELPVDPLTTKPNDSCPKCGGSQFLPDTDVMDTWATSSMSPQIVGRWLEDPDLYHKVFPFSLRPQAHEIIRTWAFYTIVKSTYHFNTIPWHTALISGWGLAPDGTEKLSKSRGNATISPLEMIENYSADAVRYWAASTSLGKDAVINEERIQAGAKLATKLWNVARFSSKFLSGFKPSASDSGAPYPLSPADRWILARTNALIIRSTDLWEENDYAGAKAEVEIFFWRDLADNYLEMAKKRLYDGIQSEGAQLALSRSLLVTLKCLAPLLPHVTEQVYQGLFAAGEGYSSIHRSPWPEIDAFGMDPSAIALGELLVLIATNVRRFKSDHNLSLGSELSAVKLAVKGEKLRGSLKEAEGDLISISRANQIIVSEKINPGMEIIYEDRELSIAVSP